MKKILFIISEDWYFYSHRFELAKSAIKKGHQVGLLSHFAKHKDRIEAEGIITFKWDLDRRSKNILKEIKAIYNIFSTVKKFNPDLIHAVAMKPVIYSSIASYFSGLKNKVFALAGLGYVFTSKNIKAKILLFGIKYLLRVFLKGKKTLLILQNPEDMSALINANIVKKERIRIIRGAGVNTKEFKWSPITKNTPIVILPSRMLWAKGILDFIECSKIINKDKKIARFALVGSPDNQNPDSISTEILNKWNEENIIEWWGYCDDMSKTYKKATIVCLPSIYGEGLPKALLESASCGRPIVTYDIPGCREIVIDGYNGFLVKPKNIPALEKSISSLISSHDLCMKMGKNGRKLVLNDFNKDIIFQQTSEVWDELLLR